jgi:SAM-dependent methyltransferase
MDNQAPETPGVVIGNHTQKYTARNPAIRLLTERWVANLERMFDLVAGDPAGPPARALEVGCGEGVIADRTQRRWGEVVALDLPDAGLRADWRRYPGPRFLHASAHELPFGDHRFDVVVAAGVLEHLPTRSGACARWPGSGGATWSCRCRGSRSSAPATCSPVAMCATSATPPATSTTGPGAASSASSPRSRRCGR